MKHLFLIALIPTLSLAAEDGEKNYQMFCSACHGNDGIGAANNPNPPLAGSEWLKGGPERAISAIMVGLKGPIEVKGKPYNLIMPPQGAVLSDEQMASILTYVRSSFDNKEKPVEPAQIAQIRAELEGRTEYFTADELRKKYPIPYPRTWPRLENLISHVYKGKWEFMPDFSKLEPAAIEEEPRNLLDVAHAGEHKKEFGIVWTGEFVSNRESDYHIFLDASDGARLFLNDVLILEVKGVGPRGAERARRLRTRFIKGTYKFRLEFFNNQGDPGLTLQINNNIWLSESRLKITASPEKIPVVAEKGSAVIYRNFIKDSRPRTIAVGYDGGVNQTFDIERLGLSLIWQGDFINGGKHWVNRGGGPNVPAGKDIIKLLNLDSPAFAKLDDPSLKWPNDSDLETRYGGYSFDENQIPTFRYTVQGTQVKDRSSFQPTNGKRSLLRNIQFTGSIPSNLQMAIATGLKINAIEGGFLIEDKVKISIKGAEATLSESEGLSTLSIPVTESSAIITYTWN